ncbi:zinc-binding dehydrogenase [Microbacterium gorillae]|uniref:zinc-binding dehydrogenase n=1 Tax=Microbacterium gorillae TaxID=1231063 RepID=UPI00058B5EE5|nr:zinc-binding dehydrogenase [Microbacterium gorillae]
MSPSALPTTSRAAVITEFGADLEVRDLPVPELEPGALLVRVDAATVCGSDVHVWDGSLHAGGIRPINLPVVAGHEMAGTVVGIGAGDLSYTGGGAVRSGDRITFTQGRCGTCHHCAVTLQPNLCTSRRSYGENCEAFPYLVGGFSEYCYVYPSARKIKIPDGVRSEWASAASCALRTVIAAYERVGRIEPWQTVVVQGTGPLGLFATALAKKSGAGRVIAVGAPDDRLELARAWGATDTLSVADLPTPDARIGAVADLTGGVGAEVVMEWSGARTAFAEGLEMVRRGGRYLVGGQVGPHTVEIQPSTIMKKGIDVIGSMSGADAHYFKAMDFLQRNQDEFDFDAILTNRYGLHEVGAALRGMQNLSEMKPIVDPWLA